MRREEISPEQLRTFEVIMRKCSKSIALVAALVLMLFVAGCGQETVNVPDTTRPTVTSTSPAQGATGVAVSSQVTATFSKAMTPASINGASFFLAGPVERSSRHCVVCIRYICGNFRSVS